MKLVKIQREKNIGHIFLGRTGGAISTKFQSSPYDLPAKADTSLGQKNAEIDGNKSNNQKNETDWKVD